MWPVANLLIPSGLWSGSIPGSLLIFDCKQIEELEPYLRDYHALNMTQTNYSM